VTLKDETEELHRLLAEGKGAQNALLRELEALRQELDDAEFRYQTAMAELGALRERLHAVEGSLTWRLARGMLNPLDKLLGARLKRLPFLGIRSSSDAARRSAQTYAEWIRRFDSLAAEDRRRIRLHMERLRLKPLISILLPVYNTPEPLLRACLDSVLTQLYPRWELCIADDASTEPHCRQVLAEYAQRDDRIKIIYRTENGHISRASNSALELARGEFVALLDHDDLLAEHALYLVTVELNSHPDADLIYSDEDKVDAEGRRSSPYFKPDWNPDLFTSQNFINHLGVYRTALVQSVGGFRHDFVGSQDYDLALRLMERSSPERIRHIPFILYHWRAVAGSTALGGKEKIYPLDAARRAVEEHFQRTGQPARVERTPDNLYNLPVFPLPTQPPLVSIVIPSTCKPEHVAWCRELLTATDYPHLEFVLVANNLGGEEAREALESFRRLDRVRIVDYDRPFNFSDIYNTAVSKVSGEVIGILNDDLVAISPNWLKEMVAHAVRPEVGLVGAMLYYPDDTIQHAGILLGVGGVAGHAHKRITRGSHGYFSRARLVQDFSAVTAACMVLRRTVFEEVGGFDVNLGVAFNDVDFCLRVRNRGYRILWTPQAELYHMESVTRGDDNAPEKKTRFQREVKYMQAKWPRELLTDPSYNPNLSLFSENFELGFPPRIIKPWESVDSPRPEVEICIDSPRESPRGETFLLTGWIASNKAIHGVELVAAPEISLEIEERFDVLLNKFFYLHAKGFQGRVSIAAIKDKSLTFRVFLKDQEYIHTHSF
jgi:GT2 family glycosyltransferase